MKKKLIEYGKRLIEATRSRNLNWEKISSTSCLTCVYNKQGFIICRMAFESGKKAISFNFLDENNSVPNDIFFNWHETDEDFDKLNELYDSALQTLPVIA